MGLAMPDEFLPYDGAGEAAAAPASAPGRLILRVEGQAEADAFLAAYAVEQPSGEPQQPRSGAQLPSACTACGATAVGGFEAAARQPVESFIRSCFIVSAACSSCSARAVEVRSSGGVSAQGSRLRCAGVGRLGVQCAALAWRCRMRVRLPGRLKCVGESVFCVCVLPPHLCGSGCVWRSLPTWSERCCSRHPPPLLCRSWSW